MGLRNRGEIWYFMKRINGQRFRESTGLADLKSAEGRAVEIEHDIRAGMHGWQRGTVHVIGKFRKERDVPMQPDARAALEEQLDEEGRL
jgi:site-specific recombinase XerC